MGDDDIADYGKLAEWTSRRVFILAIVGPVLTRFTT